MTIWDQLSAPFDPSLVSFRVGSTNRDKTKGMALAYLDARDIMERLDRTVGQANWSDRYKQAGSSIICELSIRVDGEWIVKSDGSGESDIEGSKGAISGALKRAAVKFGIGRYLYYTPNFWYPLEQGKWFTDQVKAKIANDFGAWQRDYFAINSSQPHTQPSRVDPPKQEVKPVEPTKQPVQQQPAPAPATNSQPAADKEIAEAFTEFLKEQSNANAARRQEGMPQLRGPDVVEHLHQMNYTNTPENPVNWNFLKDMGLTVIRAMTNELANQPTLIGDKVPF
jgi:hypothetical protein